MNIELKRFTLEPMNFQNKDHTYTVNRLASNMKVKKYISLNFDQFVKEADPNKSFDFGASYIVKKEDEILGICGTLEKDKEGIVEFWLALNPTDSNKGNGTKILVEVTSYLLDAFRNLRDIKLVIKKGNYISRQSAINGGYHLTDTDDVNDSEIYRYFG